MVLLVSLLGELILLFYFTKHKYVQGLSPLNHIFSNYFYENASWLSIIHPHGSLQNLILVEEGGMEH